MVKTLYWRGPGWYASTIIEGREFVYNVGNRNEDCARFTAQQYHLNDDVVWFDEKVYKYWPGMLINL